MFARLLHFSGLLACSITASSDAAHSSFSEKMCQLDYSKLFPGTSTSGVGPCEPMMASNFMPHTCSPVQCKPFLERMLSACIGQHIPDVPLGNSLAGSIFKKSHVDAIISAVKMAGCKLKSFEQLARLAPKKDATENPLEEETIAERASLKKLKPTGNYEMIIFGTVMNVSPAKFKRHSTQFLDAFASAIGFWGDAGVLTMVKIGGAGMESTFEIKIARQSRAQVGKIAKSIDADACKSEIVRVLMENPFNNLQLKAKAIDFLKPIKSHLGTAAPLLAISDADGGQNLSGERTPLDGIKVKRGQEAPEKPHYMIVVFGVVAALGVWIYYERKDRGPAGYSRAARDEDRPTEMRSRNKGGRRDTADRLEGGDPRGKSDIRRRSSGGGAAY